MAVVTSVNISTEKGTIKTPVKSIYLKKGVGIEGDAHRGNWHRQISLLAVESINKMNDLGVQNLHPGIFAENITTKGIKLSTLPVGTILKIGQGMVVMTQIGKKCHKGCDIFKQVGKCIMPYEGVFAKVIVEGNVGIGDEIRVIDKPSVGIIIISDKGYRNEREDQVIPILSKLLGEDYVIFDTIIIPDEKNQITETMKRMIDIDKIDIVISSGGTGLSPRDVTPEATKLILEREIPGISEALRYQSMQYTKFACLSRGLCGTRGESLIINLPGSPKAINQCMGYIKEILPHCIETIKGKAYECATCL